MNSGVLIMMLIVSIGIGLIGLLAFFWALKTNQFEDGERMMQNALFDNEEELNSAKTLEEKRGSKS